jgi:hypothetical protein
MLGTARKILLFDGGAIAPVVEQDTGSQTTGGATSDTATFATATVTGRGVIVVLALKGARQVSTITDNKGNTYVRVGRAADSTDCSVEMWYAQPITGGASHQITVTFDGTTYCVWGALEASRVKGGGAFLDTRTVNTTTRGGSGSSAAVTIVSGLPRSANELFVAMMGVAGGGADAGIDTPSAWTNLTLFQDYDGTMAGHGDHRINVNANTVSATWTNDTTTSPYAAIIAGFRGENGISGGIPPPVNTVAPAITGTTTEDETLTCSTGTWNNSPASYTYQWKDDGVAISGAVASTYVLTASEVGATITCTVTAYNDGGSASATAAGVGPVEAANLITSPDDFTNAAWTKTNVSVDADTVTDATTGAIGTMSQSVTVAASTWYRFEADFLKEGTAVTKAVRFNSDQDAVINVQDGTITTAQQYGLEASISDASTHWHVVIDVLTKVGQTSLPVVIIPANANTTATGSVTVANMTLDLLAAAATTASNLLAAENDFTQANWTKSNATSWANTLYDSSASVQGYASQSISLTADTIYEASARIRKDSVAGTTRVVQLFAGSTSTLPVSVYMDTSTGAVVFTSSAVISAAVTDETTYWALAVQFYGTGSSQPIGFAPGRASYSSPTLTINSTVTGVLNAVRQALLVSSTVTPDGANLLTGENNFLDAAWTDSNAKVWANVLTDSNGAAFTSVSQTATVTASTAYTFSMRIKKDNSTIRCDVILGAVTVSIRKDTGATTSTDGGYVASSTDLGDYYRLTVTFTTGAVSSLAVTIRPAGSSSVNTGTCIIDQVVLK